MIDASIKSTVLQDVLMREPTRLASLSSMRHFPAFRDGSTGRLLQCDAAVLLRADELHRRSGNTRNCLLQTKDIFSASAKVCQGCRCLYRIE
jgi:hypothetical protein